MSWISFFLSSVCSIFMFWSLAFLHMDTVDIQAKPSPPTTFYKLHKVATLQKTFKRPQKKKVEKKSPPKKKITPTHSLKPAPSPPKTEEKSEDTVKSVQELNTNVVMLNSILPKYPKLARRAGIEAKVLVEVIINEKGKAIFTKVLHCSKPGYQFEENAIKAIKKTKFKPILDHNIPVKAKFVYPIQFVLIE